MKPATRELLRSVVKLVDEDVAELRDAVAQIDAKAGEAWHAYRLRDEVMMEHAATVDSLSQEVRTLVARVSELESREVVGHSRRV